LHDLRPTVALSAGIHPKIVSERLGHASIGITLDAYSHVLPSISKGLANAVANVTSEREGRKWAENWSGRFAGNVCSPG
jgi:integrase